MQTDVYKNNQEAKRIVVTEFGTKAVPDPCQSIFQRFIIKEQKSFKKNISHKFLFCKFDSFVRVSSVFNPFGSLSDNSMISVYPFGDEYYTFTESPVVHRIDPKTLETKNKVNNIVIKSLLTNEIDVCLFFR